MNPPSFATHWARELGAAEESLIQLNGGINNRVYRCGEGSARWVIKDYLAIEQGERDRMQAEVMFLTYAAKVASQYVPELIHVDFQHRCVVLEHIDGTSYHEGVAPSPDDIKAAVDFFRLLNSATKEARQVCQLNAAEGFLQLTDHIENVRERLSRMSTDHLPQKAKKQAVELIQWVQDATERASILILESISNGTVANSINPEQRCISPSDFGFHNAIRTRSGVKFFDFEFAGWDDPAKTIVDFRLQPEIPVNIWPSPLLLEVSLEFRELISSRIEIMYQVQKLKWVCIIANILDPSRFKRLLDTKNISNLDEFLIDRIQKATSMLSKF